MKELLVVQLFCTNHACFIALCLVFDALQVLKFWIDLILLVDAWLMTQLDDRQ